MGSERTTLLKRTTQLSNLLLGLFLMLTIPLLFTPELAVENHRLMPFIWNIGHILLFFALAWLTMNLLKLPDRVGFFSLLLLANLAILILGIGIEGIQSLQARQSSWEDVYKNCLGVSVAIMFHPKTPVVPGSLKRFLQIFLVVLLLTAFYPLAKNTIDWIYAHSSFPILADFETPFEFERWSGDGLEIKKSEDGNHLLKKTFMTKGYSAITFRHFPSNWEGYNCFKFDIQNPGADNVLLRIRISDQQHNETNRAFFDRFNHKLTIIPGPNTIQMPIEKLRQAPTKREMDISKIAEIAIFTANLAAPAELLFDNFRLTSEAAACDFSRDPDSWSTITSRLCQTGRLLPFAK